MAWQYASQEDQTIRATPQTAPLADRMRPSNLDEIVGQRHLLGEGKPFRKAISGSRPPSFILWGPPGTGKTTIARLVAEICGATFLPFSAVTSGIKEIKDTIARIRHQRSLFEDVAVLFVDEIHRFNKAQQDAFLPYVEDGTIVLIGATTENPSFEVISALLSRARVFTLDPLAPAEVETVVRRALSDPDRGLGSMRLDITPEAIHRIADWADGDARRALNALEMAALSVDPQEGGTLGAVLLEDVLQKKSLLYDKGGEEHYNLISAFHKSLRGSDPDASLYWLARMIEGGEDPLFIARRMVRCASEDVGNADPRAISITMDAMEAYRFLGSPEGELALAQAALYLATAPKSNAVYVAYGHAVEDVRNQPAEPVPMHIRNAPTRLMKELGYGKGYQYAHDTPEAYVPQDYLPPSIRGHTYYIPTEHGYEKRIGEMMAWWKSIRERRSPQAPP